MKKRPNPATAHTQSRQRGAQTTSRSSALVRGRSTQFIANPCRWPQRPCPKRGYISAIFPPFLLDMVPVTWYICVSLFRRFQSRYSTSQTPALTGLSVSFQLNSCHRWQVCQFPTRPIPVSVSWVIPRVNLAHTTCAFQVVAVENTPSEH